jgi:hypothetical protein
MPRIGLKVRFLLFCLVFLLCAQFVSAKLSLLSLQGYISDSAGNPVSGTLAVEIKEAGGVSVYVEDFPGKVNNGLFSVYLGANLEHPLGLICNDYYELRLGFIDLEDGYHPLGDAYRFMACGGDLYKDAALIVEKVEIISDEASTGITLSSGGSTSEIIQCAVAGGCGAYDFGLNFKSDGNIRFESPQTQFEEKVIVEDSVYVGGVDITEGAGSVLIPSGFCVFSVDAEECPDGWEEQILFENRTLRLDGTMGDYEGEDNHTHDDFQYDYTGSWDDDSGPPNGLAASGEATKWWDDLPREERCDRGLEWCAKMDPEEEEFNAENNWPPYVWVKICCKK